MEKLLHERLQQYSADDLSFGLLDGTRVSALYAREAKAIANEIEHYYIPRPRFEDGKPVQFGDDIEIHNQSGLLDKGIIRSFHPNKGPVWMLSLVGCDHERLVRYDPDTCVIKRPVFDANGERICKGDTVWDLDSGKRLHVEEFANRECGLVQCSNEEDGDCEDHDARRLTHREPDSLEKLLERMEEYAQKNEGYIDGSKVGDFSKELRALIERGA